MNGVKLMLAAIVSRKPYTVVIAGVKEISVVNMTPNAWLTVDVSEIVADIMEPKALYKTGVNPMVVVCMRVIA